MWFGVGPNGQLVFGLPGNPVATLICLVRYVLPALHASMLGRTRRPARVVIADAVPGRGVANFLPVTLRTEDTTPALVSARIPQGSGDFLSLAGTDGFVELPPQPQGYATGYVADFHRW
jgi:molybdopterin molybdotransferase